MKAIRILSLALLFLSLPALANAECRRARAIEFDEQRVGDEEIGR